jgi:hypothetical protein
VNVALSFYCMGDTFVFNFFNPPKPPFQGGVLNSPFFKGGQGDLLFFDR